MADEKNEFQVKAAEEKAQAADPVYEEDTESVAAEVLGADDDVLVDPGTDEDGYVDPSQIKLED